MPTLTWTSLVHGTWVLLSHPVLCTWPLLTRTSWGSSAAKATWCRRARHPSHRETAPPAGQLAIRARSRTQFGESQAAVSLFVLKRHSVCVGGLKEHISWCVIVRYMYQRWWMCVTLTMRPVIHRKKSAFFICSKEWGGYYCFIFTLYKYQLWSTVLWIKKVF